MMMPPTSSAPPRGFVSLVGAGPGDVDLLTLRALRRIVEADLVLYDALVDPAVVAMATEAQRFSVGKRARRRSIAQPTIERLMIRSARRGKRVVRLKSGDPFVLGRGGEEALALSRAGVPFEIVPGVTSAVAAATLAGVPVTHRGVASGFLVVSGHAEDAFGPLLDGVPPNQVTVIVLMGMASRAHIANRLLGAGWRPDTPFAVVRAAGGPRMATTFGRLDELGLDGDVAGSPDAPGTIIVGDVVSRRAGDAGRSPADLLSGAIPSSHQW